MLGKDSIKALEFCEHCLFGKEKRLKFFFVVHHTKGTLDYIHSDLWGSSRVPSHSGAKDLLSFIDDFSIKVWVYILKIKDESFAKFKEWKNLIETQTGRKIKRLRTDNGLEFFSEDFYQFCKENVIARHKTIRGIPQQNRLGERMNRTIIERVRFLLSNANCS